MNKRFFFYLLMMLALLSLLLTGCGLNLTTEEAKYLPEEDFPFVYGNDGGGNTVITESEDGYYFITGNYLFFAGKDDLKPVVVCQKPSCLHYLEDDVYRVADCGGFVRSGVRPWVQYYGGKLYFIEEIDGLEADLIEMDTESGSRKKLYRFEEGVSLLAIHRGNLFFSNIAYKTDGESAYSLQFISLQSSSPKAKTLYKGSLAGGSIQSVMPYQNSVYFREDAVIDKQYISQLMEYNCLTGEIIRLNEPREEDGYTYRTSLVGFYQDKLLMLWSRLSEEGEYAFKFKWRDIQTKSEDDADLLPGQTYVAHYTDGVYGYLCDTYSEKHTLNMYATASKQLVSIPLDDEFNSYVFPGNELLFLSSPYNAKIIAYDKGELSQGVINPIVVFDVDVNELFKASITSVE